MSNVDNSEKTKIVNGIITETVFRVNKDNILNIGFHINTQIGSVYFDITRRHKVLQEAIVFLFGQFSCTSWEEFGMKAIRCQFTQDDKIVSIGDFLKDIWF